MVRNWGQPTTLFTATVASLHVEWKQYRILFVESEDHVHLLNRTAGQFFYVIQKVLREDIILGVARLVDPVKSVGRKNLSLAGLNEALKELQNAPDLADLVTRAEAAARFARDWRNRYIAHRDFDLAIGVTSAPLDEISHEDIDGALAAFQAVFDRIEAHYWQSTVAFRHVIVRDGAESLIHYLRVAIGAEKR